MGRILLQKQKKVSEAAEIRHILMRGDETIKKFQQLKDKYHFNSEDLFDHQAMGEHHLKSRGIINIIRFLVSLKENYRQIDRKDYLDAAMNTSKMQIAEQRWQVADLLKFLSDNYPKKSNKNEWFKAFKYDHEDEERMLRTIFHKSQDSDVIAREFADPGYVITNKHLYKVSLDEGILGREMLGYQVYANEWTRLLLTRNHVLIKFGNVMRDGKKITSPHVVHLVRSIN